MKKQTPKRKTEAKTPQPGTAREPQAVYQPGSPSSVPANLYAKGVTEPAEFTPEEFESLIAEAEAGPFYTLEESDRIFEAWEKEFLKKHGINP